MTRIVNIRDKIKTKTAYPCIIHNNKEMIKRTRIDSYPFIKTDFARATALPAPAGAGVEVGEASSWA